MIRSGLIFLELDRPTISGRIYPKDVVQKALVEYQQKIDQGQACGCFVTDINLQTSVIDLQNVSHRITSAKIIDDNLIGAIATVPTPKGQFLETIIDNLEYHFDTRGTGRVQNGMIYDYTIVSIDVYYMPGQKRPTINNPVSDYDRAMGIIKR